jgi:transcriptional regulator with XRE-family HTH domain
MESAFSEILSAYRTENELTKLEMSAILGISERMYAYYERGDYDGSPKKVKKYLALLSGKKEKQFSETAAHYQAKSCIPVYDLEATAGDIEWNGDMPERITGYITLPSFRECVAFLYVRGDSMYSLLKSGDIVGLIPVTDMGIIQYGNIYLIVTTDNQRMIKFIRRGEDDEHLVLRSKNEAYDDIHLNRSKIRKLFRVKGPIRDDWQ